MLKLTLVLLTAGLLVAGPGASGQGGKDPKQAERAKCVATCKSSCTKSYDSCKRNATTTTALTACQQSLKTCSGNCLNKACE